MKKIFYIEDDDEHLSIRDKTHKDSSLQFLKYSNQKETFHQIDRNLLIPGEEVIFNIFIHQGIDFQPIIQATDKLPIKLSEKILDLEGDFLIKQSELPLYKEYLESIHNKIILDKEREKTKVLLIKESTKLTIREILSEPRSGEDLKKAEPVVHAMTTAILSNRDVIFDLISIKTYDYYTYTHSTNVEILSIGLGVTLGLTGTEIFNLGLGTLLHDIGKCFIPAEILNKQGKLTKFEFNIIQRHVIEGEKILKQSKKIPEESLYAALQHHEKLSGNGYPYRLSNSDIHLLGRISAITDCYDALTTDRPYKKALTPYEALDMMLQERRSYDIKLLEIFIKMLGKKI